MKHLYAVVYTEDILQEGVGQIVGVYEDKMACLEDCVYSLFGINDEECIISFTDEGNIVLSDVKVCRKMATIMSMRLNELV